MHTRAVECYGGGCRALLCCMLARKFDQGLVLCIPVLLYYLVVKLISSGRQPIVRGKRATALSNEFCTVQVLKELKNLFLLRNSGVFGFQGL